MIVTDAIQISASQQSISTSFIALLPFAVSKYVLAEHTRIGANTVYPTRESYSQISSRFAEQHHGHRIWECKSVVCLRCFRSSSIVPHHDTAMSLILHPRCICAIAPEYLPFRADDVGIRLLLNSTRCRGFGALQFDSPKLRANGLCRSHRR